SGSGAIDAVVSRALEKSKSDRFPSMRELEDALARASSSLSSLPPTSAMASAPTVAVRITPPLTPGQSAPPTPSDAEPGRSAPRAITDGPYPATNVPEALTRYRAALGAFRDADWRTAHLRLQQALELEPELPEANL